MLLRLWILFCAAFVAAGWLLSLFQSLNLAGYLVALLILGAGCRAKFDAIRGNEPIFPRRQIRRLNSVKLLLPWLFAVLAVILLCRGLVLPPFHGDGLSYRIPRVMSWIMEGHWYWIDAQDPRLNTRGMVSEWLTVPILLTFPWDHLVFLPNWISLLFFPQLVFQVWRDWGVPSRIAWYWMWLLPAGFCYSLQACNSSNDILATFFALAAFALLRRGRKVPPVDLLCSLLSIALATGVKLTMLPLAVPWAILAFSQVRIFLRWPKLTLVGAAWSALISFVPNVVANIVHVGDPSGLSLEPSVLRHAPYLDRFVGNLFIIFLNNVTFPTLAYLTRFGALLKAFGVGQIVDREFETDTLYLYPYYSVEQEGLGIMVLLAGGMIFLFAFTRGYAARSWRRLTETRTRLLMHVAMWALFFFFMFVSTSAQPARLVSGYYPFVLTTFFVGSGFVVGRRRFLTKAFAVLALVGVIFCALFATDYPLIALGSDFSGQSRFEIAQEIYLNRVVPPSEKAIGLMRYWNEWESWAWKPYGSRQVYELPESPAPADLARDQIHYVIITQHFLTARSERIEDWVAAHRAHVVGQLLTKGYPMGYYIVQFDAANPAADAGNSP